MSNYMGCGAQLDKDNFKQKLLELEESGKYVAEEKLDGQWAEVWVRKGKVIKIKSRTGKIKPFESLLAYKFRPWVTGIFVGEMGYGSTNSKLRENLIVIYDWVKVIHNDTMLNAEKWQNMKRRIILKVVLSDLHKGVILVERRSRNFYTFYQRILKEHGEGLIIKKMFGKDTVYKKGTYSSNWIKVKKGVEVDMVIMSLNWRQAKDMSAITKNKGADKYIKNIVCGQYFKGKLRSQVRVGSMIDEARKWFSNNYRDALGRVVVTIRGFEQFQKTGSIRHCSLVIGDDGKFIREDLTPKDCVFGKIKLI